MCLFLYIHTVESTYIHNILVFTFFPVSSSKALRCYSCRSDGIEDCADPFNASSNYTTVCDGRCEKTVVSGLGVKTVTRNCSRICSPATYRLTPTHTKTTCCTEDLCNDAYIERMHLYYIFFNLLLIICIS